MNRSTDLNDGRSMPLIGLGVMKIPNETVPQAMRQAVELGYRLFDTAPVYRNEGGVGRGVKACGLPRDEVFVTTKLWNTRQGFDETLRAFDESIATLGLDYVDLYLIHWPVPARGLYVESWKALIRLRNEGRVRSIGVSNFMQAHLQRIIDETGVAPAVNQIEFHPAWQQHAVVAAGNRLKVITQAWSPLCRGATLSDPRIIAAATKIGCSSAQLVLRWMTQTGIAVIPKASSKGHMQENFDSLDLKLDAETAAILEAMDDPSGRIGPDPNVFETMTAA
jgi:2,5-diketo-D-gluconate reductase A